MKRDLGSDECVQATADDAAAGKLSAVMLGYFKDPFLQYFVNAQGRRPPVINRGNFARVACIDKLVRDFLSPQPRPPPQAPNPSPVPPPPATETCRGGRGSQVVSLGAGKDTLFFRLKEEGVFCPPPGGYFEVDFPVVSSWKASVIQRVPRLAALAGYPFAQTRGDSCCSDVVQDESTYAADADARGPAAPVNCTGGGSVDKDKPRASGTGAEVGTALKAETGGGGAMGETKPQGIIGLGSQGAGTGPGPLPVLSTSDEPRIGSGGKSGIDPPGDVGDQSSCCGNGGERSEGPRGRRARRGGYHLIEADLRDCEAVEAALRAAGLDPSAPTLILAECVLVYMEEAESSRLVQWCSSLFSCAMFAAYEMTEASDSFGKMMISNIQRRGCRLPGLIAFPSLEDQEDRFLRRGWEACKVENMLTVFEEFIDKAAVRRASEVEVLDEVEEWRLIMSHYCLVVAAKGKDMVRRLAEMRLGPCQRGRERVQENHDSYIPKTITTVPVSRADDIVLQGGGSRQGEFLLKWDHHRDTAFSSGEDEIALQSWARRGVVDNTGHPLPIAPLPLLKEPGVTPCGVEEQWAVDV